MRSFVSCELKNVVKSTWKLKLKNLKGMWFATQQRNVSVKSDFILITAMSRIIIIIISLLLVAVAAIVSVSVGEEVEQQSYNLDA